MVEARQRFADPGQGDVRRLRGATDEHRLRVGDWRVRFRLIGEHHDTIEVIRVLPRGRAYRD
jgi:mRNA interferase RelE/StbE